ncbi:MAG TPA: RsmE family RNA methyltransferase [Candidatus Hydromicrobium sp.]
MSYPYFFINPGSSIEGNKIKIIGEDLNHLVNVLRSKVGDTVYVSDNADYKYETEILDIKKPEVILLVKYKRRIARKIPQLTLFQCVLKKNSMEFVIQKSTEIGVDRIIPVTSARVVTDKNKIAGKTSRWQKISDGASKQSRRDYKCEILPPEDIYNIKVSDYDLFYIPYEESSGRGENLTEVKNTSRVGYVIGPEGGFETGELNFLKERGAREIRFGKNIYRSETAAIYFLSVLDYLTGNQK